MAVAAETITFERPPELEVYGRSLSTIYRLGAFMVGKAIAETVHSPEAQQARVEFYTSVEEGFGTDMELGGGLEVRDFDERAVIAGKVMSKDLKTPISDMTDAGLICAQETAKTDRRFLPQLTRSKWDHENALEVDKMTRGETGYNTRIVVSPFPEEAAVLSGDAYWRNIGYVPHLKRGFVQLYHVTESGEVITGSLSFDGSNKERLRTVFAQLGIKIPDTEITDNWLRNAITGKFSTEAAKALALEIADKAANPAYKKDTNTVDVTDKYQAVIDTVFNESYVHACESVARGYQTLATRRLILQLADKAANFNRRYAKALYGMRADERRFSDDDMVVVHELLVYSTIEMMRALYLGEKTASNAVRTESTQALDASHLQALTVEAFQCALGGFAAEGASNNRTYSACGLSISLGELNDSADKPQSAFGGIESTVNSDCEYISKSCPMCKAKNVRTKVSKLDFGNRKRISGSCGCVKIA